MAFDKLAAGGNLIDRFGTPWIVNGELLIWPKAARWWLRPWN
ncbi:MAG TPA: hypothetical protein VHW25_05755 [Steroidobacteraceae bacterium]|jgi:hypothetical protein|nr:hypothetical protein [Steroidobacteraceae bacterium]